MSSESDPEKPDEPPKAPAAEPDPSSPVAIKLEDIPDASTRPATSADEPLPELPASEDAPAASSGSIDVALSTPGMPASASGSVDIAVSSDAIPRAAAGSGSKPHADDSQPIFASTGVVKAVTANEGTGPARRAKRVTSSVQDALSGGVEKLGQGIGIVGEAVEKVGDLTKKVPLVGASVGKLGEGLSKAGESIHALPQVAKTRRGRLLVRSVIVGFLLVFSWIAVIVWFQLRAHDTPDFRPAAEEILVAISKGRPSIAELYERASPRFQELVKKEQFIDNMMDLNATNGRFREITAINETLVTTGPTGKVGRVGLTAAYEKGISKGSISFHWDKGRWKLLGLGIEVPEDLEITQAERQKRIAACLDDKGHDVSDQRNKCDVRDAAETILEDIRDGKAGQVWDNANAIFKQQETRARFIQLHEEARAVLGNYKRVLTVTDARAIGGVSASFDIVCEFERASGVRVDFDFTRHDKYDRWQLARLKITLPMPRPEELQPDGSAAPPATDAGVRGP